MPDFPMSGGSGGSWFASNYHTVFLVAAGVLAIIGCVCLHFYGRNKRLLDEIWAVDTYDSKELARMCSGGFDATVEVQGTVSCDQPIDSYAAQVQCCWFHTHVDREDETTTTRTDSDGHTHTETSHSWQSAMDVTHGTVFKVHDQTGFTLIDPTRAEIDAQTVRSEVIHHREPWFEGVRMSDTGRYRIKEDAFLPEGYAFVLGRATETPGGVLIHLPEEGYADSKTRFFIISRKNEQQLTRAKQKSQAACFWGAIITFFGAAFLLLAASGLVHLGIR